jgi:hypothetical protein
MDQSFRDELSELPSPLLAGAIAEKVKDLTALLAAVPGDRVERIISLLPLAIRTECPSPPQAPVGEVTPELLAWARQQFSEDEIAAGIREIRETGGLALADFYHELADPTDAHE